MLNISVILDRALSKRIRARNVYTKPRSERRGSGGYSNLQVDIESYLNEYFNSVPVPETPPNPTSEDFGFDTSGTEFPSTVKNVSQALKNLSVRL